MGLSKLMKSTAVALALAGAMLGAAPVQAGVVKVSLWQSSTAGNGPEEQASPLNPLALNAPTTTFDYLGVVNWRVNGQDNTLNKLSTFVGFGGGSISNCAGLLCSGASALSATTLSTSSFATTTLFRLIFTTTAPVSGQVKHDDGLSIYNSSNVAIYSSPAPTVEIGSLVNLATPGTYTAWYVEANGSPSVLTLPASFTVPEPTTLGLVAMTLLSLFGFAVMRRKVNV